MDEDRANTFLRMIRRAQRGRLKVYLGYCAGIGKTYQMLQEGHRLKGEGIDVVIGLLETHGRADIVKLAEGLEVVPRRRQEYRGFTVEEITDIMFQQYMLEDKEGVMVSFVEVGGPASTAMLEEDDVIIKVENFNIRNLDDFKKSLDQVKEKKEIMLTVKRGKNNRFILLSPEEKKEQTGQ